MKQKISDNSKQVAFDDKWILIIGIATVGIVFPAVVSWVLQKSLLESLGRISSVLVNTTLLWFGCRFIITKLWVLLPWQKFPLKHLFLEILLISVYTFFISFLIMVMVRSTLPYELCLEYGFWENFLFSNAISLTISFIHEGLYFFDQWKKSYIRSEVLEKENLISQFETLKSQINPHFLFNSLNTLITLIEEDRDTAVEYTQKLSDFFRSILQINNLSLIQLHEELDIIRTYFYLQQKRYGANLQLGTDIPETYLSTTIPPLCVQMLVENAIKHNIISTAQPLLVELSITESGYLTVTNNLQQRFDSQNQTGIGIQNIKNRFRFFTDKPIEIIRTSTHFTVALPLLTNLTD
jgi:sensor histidine kinase YesM